MAENAIYTILLVVNTIILMLIFKEKDEEHMRKDLIKTFALN